MLNDLALFFGWLVPYKVYQIIENYGDFILVGVIGIIFLIILINLLKD